MGVNRAGVGAGRIRIPIPGAVCSDWRHSMLATIQDVMIPYKHSIVGESNKCIHTIIILYACSITVPKCPIS